MAKHFIPNSKSAILVTERTAVHTLVASSFGCPHQRTAASAVAWP